MSFSKQINVLEKDLSTKQELLETLDNKYERHRKVWEENERKANEEIKKLDEAIDEVIETLKSIPEVVSLSVVLQNLCKKLTTNNSELDNSMTFSLIDSDDK